MPEWATLLLASVAWWGGAFLYGVCRVTRGASGPLTGGGPAGEYWSPAFAFIITRLPVFLVGYLTLAGLVLLLLQRRPR